MLQRKLYTLFLLFIAVKLIATEADPNLSYLQDYLRVRADLSGKETVYHFSGKVYSIIPEQKSMELFAVEGYNISRLKQVEAGYQLLAKEVIVFQDHRTKEILKRWRNPLTGQNLPVLHILNDPVNQSFVYEPHMLPYINHLIPSQNLGESIVYHNEIFPFYPHPLSQREYSAHVQSEYFQAVETYEYRVHKDALAVRSSRVDLLTYPNTSGDLSLRTILILLRHQRSGPSPIKTPGHTSKPWLSRQTQTKEDHDEKALYRHSYPVFSTSIRSKHEPFWQSPPQFGGS